MRHPSTRWPLKYGQLSILLLPKKGMVVQVIITHKTIPIRPSRDPFSTLAGPSAGPCDPCLQANSAATRGGPSRITPGCGKATQRLQLKNVTMNRPLREAVNHCCLEKGGPGLALLRQRTPWRDARAGHALIHRVIPGHCGTCRLLTK